jgi:predicted PhzF superfamily epimerase YddE/YHI9
MFAPRFGIPEESGTGMAAGPLACLLHKELRLQQTQLDIEQGWLMSPASPSVITVKLDLHGGHINSLLAGGRARIAQTRIIDL